MTYQEKMEHLNKDKGLIYFIALKYYRKYKLEKDDAVQYCYMAYWTGLDEWDPDKSALSAFMGARLQQRLRVAGRAERLVKGTSKVSISIVNESNGFDFSLLRDDRTPEQEYFTKAFVRDILEKATVRFSKRDQVIAVEYFIEGMKLEALAYKYGISKQRVQQIMGRVKEHVKEKLGL